MDTEAAIQSVRDFEEKRAAENYTEDTGTVLNRVPAMEYTGPYGLKFALKAGVVDRHDSKGWVGNGEWEAELGCRSCTYTGSTPEEAIGNMLLGVAKLARDGSVDPDHPERVGAPPIQHCINILCERLQWHAERRQEALRDRDKEAARRGDSPGASFMSEQAARDAAAARFMAAHNHAPLIAGHNDAISALGTAISALARIKDQ